MPALLRERRKILSKKPRIFGLVVHQWFLDSGFRLSARQAIYKLRRRFTRKQIDPKDPPIRVLRAFVVDWARLYHEGAKSQVSGCVFAALPVFIRGGEARDYGNSVVKEDPIMV